MSVNPGCYGSSLCCKPKGDICSICPLVAECEKQAKRRAKYLRETFGIKELLLPVGRGRPKSVPILEGV